MSRFSSDLEDGINLRNFSQVSAALPGCHEWCYHCVKCWSQQCHDRLSEGERTEDGPILLKPRRGTAVQLPNFTFCSAPAFSRRTCKGLGSCSFCWLEALMSSKSGFSPNWKGSVLGNLICKADASGWSLFLLEQCEAGGAVLDCGGPGDSWRGPSLSHEWGPAITTRLARCAHPPASAHVTQYRPGLKKESSREGTVTCHNPYP